MSIMTDALTDRWMPRSGVQLRRHRAAAAHAIDQFEHADEYGAPNRRAMPGYTGENPDQMQGSLRLK